VKLRLAGAGDLALLVAAIGADYFDRAHPAVPRPTPARISAIVAGALETAVVAIAEDPRYVGSVALRLAPWDWSDDLALCDRWLHVRRDRRGGSAVRHLVRFGLALARHRGVPFYIGAGFGGRSRVLR